MMGKIYFVQEQNRGHHMTSLVLNIRTYTYLKACSPRNTLGALVASRKGNWKMGSGTGEKPNFPVS